MDWIQALTIISTTITTFAAGGYTLHSFLRGDIKEFKQEIKEDMRALEERFDRRMEVFEQRMMQMDEKWERLFERLLVQDKERRAQT